MDSRLRKMLGWVVISLPYATGTAAILIAIGWQHMLVVVGGAAFVFACLWFGEWLINGQGE